MLNFEEGFECKRRVFLRIVEALGNNDEYFRMRFDATSRMGISPLQKCNVAIRILAYGSFADSVDDYVRISENTAVECLERFVKGVYAVFGDVYLRRPNNEDITRRLQMGEAHGFLVILGSIDCMHYEWKNFPVAWKGLYSRGDHDKSTIMLEAVTSQDLWICYAFFGIAGSNNNISVLNKSNVFSDVLNGVAPPVQYTVNRTPYNMGYFLADDIYLEWATFVKTIPTPQREKKNYLANDKNQQERTSNGQLESSGLDS